MAQEKEGLVRFEIDAKTSLFTVRAFAAGMVAVMAHSPKYAIRSIVGEINRFPPSPEPRYA
jgi:hypothetical protein